MTQTPPQLSPEEREQILQTIEMFEVIVQASPNDVQSIEILKDAYLRVGRLEGATQTGRRLAELYVSAEQYSAAAAEYELILAREPENVEVMAALGDLEQKLTQAQAAPAPAHSIDLNFQNVTGSNLIATTRTARHSFEDPSANGAAAEIAINLPADDGCDAMARFLLQHRIAPEDVVRTAVDRVTKKNKDLGPGTMAHSFLDEVVRRGGLDMETTLCAIVDRSKLAYIPLDCYEVDRQIVKMLPESLTLGRLIVPFDVLSRTLMVAMANPFDLAGKQAVQQLLDYNIQWHIASPSAVIKVLCETYRVAGPGMIGTGTQSAAPAFKLATS